MEEQLRLSRQFGPLVLLGVFVFVQFFSWLFFLPAISIQGLTIVLYVPGCMTFGILVTPALYIYERYIDRLSIS